MKKFLKILFIYFCIECLIPFAGNSFVLEFEPETNSSEEASEPYEMVNDEGPSQPEVQTFQPVGTTDLVDPFTGDFSYNIPLLDIGGYPINIFYQSGVTMEENASWVGLGWNLNPGAINRNVRGLPDDFDGDTITKEYNTKPNKTWGLSYSPDLEVTGLNIPIINSLSAGYKILLSYNNYRGYGLELSNNLGISAGSKFKMSLNAGTGIGSERGSFYTASLGASFQNEKLLNGISGSLQGSISGDSREGLNSLYVNGNINRSRVGIQRSSHIDFASQTYYPTIETGMTGFSINGSLKVGVEAFCLYPNASVSGYFSIQKVADQIKNVPAYGYLNLQHCNNNRGLLDFTRENDGIYRKENPDLPLTNMTYDVYDVSGQGISGSYRPYRGDFGAVSDPEVKSTTMPAADVSGEIGAGGYLRIGADLALTLTNDISGRWGSDASSKLLFQNKDQLNPQFEPVYFKRMGETTVMSNPSMYDSCGTTEPVKIYIDRDYNAQNFLVNNNYKTVSFINNDLFFKKIKREHRNSLFTFLNGEEAETFGLEKFITIRQVNYFGPPTYDESNFNTDKTFFVRNDLYFIHRNLDFRKAHHISEVTVTKDDGARYIYGIPVYNTLKKEVSFNISGTPEQPAIIDNNNKFVTYTRGDNSSRNAHGINHYFNRITTPPYAYAYLLTAIVSPDYVDLTGDGPSSDDFGTYTKFNYSIGSEKYNWREPYNKNTANYQEGSHFDNQDDIANYIYGEKEIYYLHSIETKNYIAEFTIAPRVDGFGVLDENGGMNSASGQQLYKLIKIELYSKAERLMLQDKALPIKTVHFEYDYSLCPGIPSNDPTKTDVNGAPNSGGKLTLKKIYYTYEKSKKGIYSPYVFTYGNNPRYDVRAMDRWGKYKPNVNSEPAMNNIRFPYTDQSIRESNSDKYTSAWLMNSIKLPTGSVMNIDYEADDYGYVQNKRAMQMFMLQSPVETINEGNDIYNKNYFIIKLNNPLLLKDTNILFEYVNGISELYFNCRVNLIDSRSENIPGFIKIDTSQPLIDIIEFYGDLTENKYNYAKIKFKPVSIGDNGNVSVNPVSKATWQFINTNLPLFRHEADEAPESDDITDAISRLLNYAAQYVSGRDDYDQMYHDRVANSIDLNQSYIRLNNPDKIKIGGGVRVKKITVNDEWGEMQQPVNQSKNFVYGTEYEYKTSENFNNSTRIISSGVAAYEPLVGGDENPFSLPDRYRIEKSGALDEYYYKMEPDGESFFPAPVVGYSKVKVKNIKREFVTSHATGSVVSEFYTAKDFPVIVQKTDPGFYEQTPGIGDDLLNGINPFWSKEYDYITTNQGYSIELNDMHGKLKRQSVFSESDSVNPISFIENRYQMDKSFKQNDTYISRLDNHALVIDEKGKLQKTYIGVETDIVADSRIQTHSSEKGSIQLNADITPAAAGIPFPIISVWPNLALENSNFKSICLTKVIQRIGIIDSVIAYDLGSTVTTTNLVYDGVTGLPLITKSSNEFNDAYYSYNIPAHHVYDRMGPAYQNIGVEFDSVEIDNSMINIKHANDFFVKGDELLIERQIAPETHLGYEHAWVDSVKRDDYISVIKEDGTNLLPGSLKRIKVIRSGRRNMQNNSIGQIVMKHNPVPDMINAESKLELDSIIDSKTTEYSEHWETYKAFQVKIPQSTCNCIGDKYTGELTTKLKSLLTLFKGDTMKGYETSLNGCIYLIKYKSEINKKETECTISLDFKKGPEFPVNIISFSDLHFLRKDKNSCPDFIYDFYVIAKHGNEKSGTMSDTLFGKSTCMPAASCSEKDLPPAYVCDLSTEGSINPFRLGLLGNFRPLKSLMYVTDRTSIADLEDISKAGIYKDFSPYWKTNTNPGPDRSKWTYTQKNAIVDPFGKVLQTEDALHRHSADLYGYGHNFVIASAKNSYYRQIAFESFEDFGFANRDSNPGECPIPEHFKFDGAVLTDQESHTGRHSILLNFSSEVSLVRAIYNIDNNTVTEGVHYKIHPGDLIGIFQPNAGDYFFSAWVKCPSQANKFLYENTSVKIIAGINDFTFLPQGNIIDGWQQINGTVHIPQSAAASSIKISLVNSSTGIIYFDDIRIQPFNSTMQAYVYDPKNLRLMATLDENNFATLYEYDEEGQLTRTKKETEEGVMTIQEIRAAKPKYPNH